MRSHGRAWNSLTPMLQFSGHYRRILSGADTSRTNRWVAAEFLDRVLFATPSVAPQYWAGGQTAREIPGLPDYNGYDGVEVFDGHVMLWSGDRIKWSDRNDFSQWLPLNQTISYGRATTAEVFTMPSVGSKTEHLSMSGLAGEFVPGQFMRVVTAGDDPNNSFYDYFRVVAASLETKNSAVSIVRAQSIQPGERAKIFFNRYSTYIDWTAGATITVDGVKTTLKVISKSRNASGGLPLSSGTGIYGSSSLGSVGTQIELYFASPPTEFLPGDVVSVGPLNEPGQDLYLLDLVGNLTRGTRISAGAVAVAAYPNGYFATFQDYVEVENTGTSFVSIRANAAVSVISSLVVEPLGWTGGTGVGKTIPIGAAVESVDANESGELVNVGASVNGSIYGIITLGEFAYILKKNSIQSIQSVGFQNGTFFVRPEILTEGPIGKYSYCRSGDREICFWGNKGIYMYGGGQNLRPIALQHYLAIRDEMDRGRIDEIVAYHNRRDSEVWFSYITTSGDTKVFVYNYLEDSIVTDRYPADLNGITAIGKVDWELAPTWESVPLTDLFSGTAKRWYEYVDVPERDYTVIGIGGDEANPALGEIAGTTIPRLLLHGRTFSRSSRDDCSPEGIEVLAETVDFDFGDAEAWKYVSTIYVFLTEQANVPAGATMQVQIGAKNNLNSPVRWSPPRDLLVTRADTMMAALPTDVCATMSGRFIRLRFSSSTPGCNWSISSYHIIARMGGVF